jgi:NTE family protein
MMLPLLVNKVLRALFPRRRRRSHRPALPSLIPEAGKPINLALQGGGAYGAFTWGVIEELLVDGRLAIDGISGASAGALNAVVLADGLARGGAAEAQRRLAEFWRAASFGGNLPELPRGVLDRMFSLVPRAALPAPWIGSLTRLLSPYDYNPLNVNPLRDLIRRRVDFDLIRDHGRDLFITATNVHTGELRVFRTTEITADAVMASACLPLLFRAVEVEGVPYWDGGYAGNPALLPFLQETATEDILIVQINPLEQRRKPRRARDILARVHEITFNAPLLAELRALELAETLIEEGRLPRGTGAGAYRRLRLHRIVMDEEPADAGNNFSTDYDYFERLRQRGRQAAQLFLESHFDDIGHRDTLRTDAAAELV